MQNIPKKQNKTRRQKSDHEHTNGKCAFFFYFPLSAFYILLFSIYYLLFSNSAMAQEAPRLFVDPAAVSATADGNFTVKIKIDTADFCVNATKADLSFSPGDLILADFSTGDSIISVWADPLSRQKIADAAKTGNLSFAGGIPGGFCEKNSDSGNNELVELVFKKNSGREARIEILPSSMLLANDGQGTALAAKFESAAVLATTTDQTGDPWAKKISRDKQPPEQFKIEINSDPAIFDGKHFIAFSTQDKQTGIDGFEISETPLDDPAAKDDWQPGSSPYRLKDQSLRSKIKVKARDLAGNETVSEYLPQISQDLLYENRLWALFLTIVIAGAIIVAIIWKKRSTKRND